MEGKYFYPTVEQAVQFGRGSFSSQGAQTIMSMTVPRSALGEAFSTHVLGEGQIIFLPGSSLPLGPVNVWTFTPVGF